MQVIITEKEINVIKTQIESILPYINEVFPESFEGEFTAETAIAAAIEKFNGEYVCGELDSTNLVLTIPEETVDTYFDLLAGYMY